MATRIFGSRSEIKILEFRADGNGKITVGTDALQNSDHTISFPDVNINDTFVLLNSPQVLTNKTINASQLVDSSITTAKIGDSQVTNVKLSTGISAEKLSSGSVSNTEFDYLDGVTSPIQSQIDSKQSEVLSTRGDLVFRDASNVTARLPVGTVGQVLTTDGTDVSWDSPAGTGDVTSSATITDNSIVKGDGGAKGVQESGILISDNDDLSGLGWQSYKSNLDSITFTSGTTNFHPNPTIPAGQTVTVNSGASVYSFGGICEGTIICEGTWISK